MKYLAPITAGVVLFALLPRAGAIDKAVFVDDFSVGSGTLGTINGWLDLSVGLASVGPGRGRRPGGP